MIEAAVRKIRLLLLPPDPESLTEDERGAERNRRAVITGGVGTIARAVQVGSSLITVPLALKYLGNERFGLWMTISSLLAMAAFADFGVGNGVLNTVAKASGKDDRESIRKAISSGFAVLSSIAILLITAFFLIYRYINWGNFFRVVTPQARLEAGPALAVFVICFALNISMDVVQRVQLGLQQGYRYSLWQLCGSIAGLIGVLAGIHFYVTLPILVMAIAGAPILATTLNALHFFLVAEPGLRPSFRLVSRDVILEIARLGSFFFVIQVVVAVSYSADNFIIARSLGALHVPEYSIPQRMFALITMMSSMLVAPLWPAYSEAFSRGHLGWIRRTLKRSLFLVFGLSSIAAAFLIIAGRSLIYWWVGSRIHPSILLLTGLALWTVVACCGDCLATFMNGVELMRFQVIVATVFGAGCLLIKVLLVRRLGVIGIPWATLTAYLLLNALPMAIFLPRFLARNQETAVDV
jgi:O-antigen/teichoic acid export membrane protein